MSSRGKHLNSAQIIFKILHCCRHTEQAGDVVLLEQHAFAVLAINPAPRTGLFMKQSQQTSSSQFPSDFYSCFMHKERRVSDKPERKHGFKTRSGQIHDFKELRLL